MKVYIAARAKYRAEEVADIQDRLIGMGHDVAYDWPSGNSAIKKPYRDPHNRQYNLAAQRKMLEAAAQSDIFVLLDSEGLRGAYVELGAFLFDCLRNGAEGRVAYIVGEKSHEREHIFESPEFVKFVDDIEQVYEDLKTKQ